MLLTINSPRIQRLLKQAAKQQGTTPADLATRLLEASFPETVASKVPASEVVASGVTASNQQSFPQTQGIGASSLERKGRFHVLIESHHIRGLPQLSPQALERASFYTDERHLVAVGQTPGSK
jgi:hypothetical protein